MDGYNFGSNKKLVGKRIMLLLILAVFSAFTAFIIVLPSDSAMALSSSECVMEVYSHRVLGSSNLDARLPMASTTKTMTALIACESGKLDDTVKIPKIAEGVEGSSIYLRAGEELKLRDLVYGLMLRSGNDSAVAIACYLGGSVEGFASIMNERAAQMGLKNTNFVNSHGLHDDNHYTSAYDLAVIASEGMKNEEFRTVVSSKKYSCGEGENIRYFTNKNKLLWSYEGCNGLKTGYTKKAGRCLVSASERNGMQVVAVVLNVPDMFGRCAALMDQAHAEYHCVSLYNKGEAIGEVPVVFGDENATVAPSENIVVPLKDGERYSVETQLPKEINSALKIGDEIGKIKISIEEELIFYRPLVTMNEVTILEKKGR